MKKMLILLLFLSVVDCNNNEPKLYFPSSEIVLRNIAFGTEEKINIEIENRGGKPLEIKSVNSSCKCIDIDFPKKKIRTNEKAIISMSYKADEKGAQRESVVIISNDPKVFKLIKINAQVNEE